MQRDTPILAHIRNDYRQGELLEKHLPAQPFELFGQWFDALLKSEPHESTAMFLATATPTGLPSLRTVLLKEYSPTEGFVFFTNYSSRKGNELAQNPQAALLFYWDKLEQQIRIEGQVVPLSDQKSDDYFAQRPKDSRIGAIASPQSQIIPSREALEERFNNLNLFYQQHPEQLTRPQNWGGYALQPTYFEFWQGRSNRLHDRITYTLNANNEWKIERLAP
jgi:pyridoxamine 5'-phosphate oxidase